uniref:Hypothetical chloroplast protein RF1 n=1 Tax=Volvocales sp. NrCl902 TaxID=2682054 RepID=A0A7G1GGA6_9CHLO|nr:hypothetical chloroplast protein RF1 [Volvocales sp. NrCl902]
MVHIITLVKDYVSILNTVIVDASLTNQTLGYNNIGTFLTFIALSIRDSIVGLFHLGTYYNSGKNVWSLPLIVPNFSSAMIGETGFSIFKGNSTLPLGSGKIWHNVLNYLDTPLLYFYTQNSLIYSLEKFAIGLINSLFLCIPNNISHLITFRYFITQGLDAGYFSGLGTICGNLLWLASVLFGWRFFVIPWLSLDVFRYIFGFLLLVKYIWENAKSEQVKTLNLNNNIWKFQIFATNFLLSLTEQSNVYPFLSNLSINPEASILEGFPVKDTFQFITVHFSYLAGIFLGSLALLHLTCWFWENPGFKLYMWCFSKIQGNSANTFNIFKAPTSMSNKALNWILLYLTMFSVLSNIPYYGLDYTITNPLGFVNDDRIVQDNLLLETSFLGTKASDRNTRRNRGRHGRRERWKRRIRKYRTFDTSLRDEGIYDLFPIEDLNYGFDRFWIRRKLRNHRVRFRFFPGPWMRNFKKQLAKPRLESYSGPRVEFFRILFEQVYHPSFHAFCNHIQKHQPKSINLLSNNTLSRIDTSSLGDNKKLNSLITTNGSFTQSIVPSKGIARTKETKKIVNTNKVELSTLRKLERKLTKRIKTSTLALELNNVSNTNVHPEINNILHLTNEKDKRVFSKRWKHFFSTLAKKSNITTSITSAVLNDVNKHKSLLTSARTRDIQILRYRTLLLKNSLNNNIRNAAVLLHPLKYYIQKQKAFSRKLRYYTPNIYRKFSIENNAPIFRTMLKRYFYNYKPTNRWERTLKVATLRKARRKTTRTPLLSTNYQNENISVPSEMKNNIRTSNSSVNKGSFVHFINKPTHNYNVVGKRASRYRFQIFKDVLQHWYYSPFNRLLLKLDVNSFIKRQPYTHFLTSKEEQLMHLRRYLLGEYNNSLRWYTKMEYYKTMKTKIGGTKSFSSRIYNHQFLGTLNKIRHLFSITPAISNNIIGNKEQKAKNVNLPKVLKFDQSLYNEYSNTKEKPFNYTYLIHEELLPALHTDSLFSGLSLKDMGMGSQVKDNVQNTIIKEVPTSCFFGEVKTNNTININNTINTKNIIKNNSNKVSLKENSIYGSSLCYDTLTFWKDRVNNQELLKNYINRRIEKREKRQQYKENRLINKLKFLYNVKKSTKSLTINQSAALNPSLNAKLTNKNRQITATTGVQKSINVNTPLNTKVTTLNALKDLQTQKTIRQYNITMSSLKNVCKKNSLNNTFNNCTTFSHLLTKLRFLISWPSFVLQTPGLLYNNTFKYLGLDKLVGVLGHRTVKKQLNSNGIYNFPEKERTLTKQKRLRKGFKKLGLKNPRFSTYSYNKSKGVKSAFILQKQNKATNSNNPLNQGSSKGSVIKVLTTVSSVTSDVTSENTQLYNRNPLRRKRLSVKSVLNSVLNKGQLSTTKTFLPLNNEAVDISTSYLTEKDPVLNNNNNIIIKLKNRLISLISKKYKRKHSPQRRSRGRPGRAMLKKHTLNESFIQEINSNYTVTFSQFTNMEKVESEQHAQQNKDKGNINKLDPLHNKNGLTNNLINIRDADISDTPLLKPFILQNLKQRKSKQRKNRYWKQKRSKFAQKQRKYRKRRRYAIGKIRTLSKQLKKIKSKGEFQYYYKTYFLSNFGISATGLIDKGKTKNSIINCVNDRLAMNPFNKLQNLNKSKALNIISKYNITGNAITGSSICNRGSIDDITNSSNSSTLINTKISPLYAGWDNTLNKFVITNLMLSRQDACYTLKTPFISSLPITDVNNNYNNTTEFTAAPLQGMNGATTLYWQTSFSTYDPDQFFALGMDGFSPIGWRKFQFRHSLLKQWLYNFNLCNKDACSGAIQKPNIINNKADSFFIVNKAEVQSNKKTLSSTSLVSIIPEGVKIINASKWKTQTYKGFNYYNNQLKTVSRRYKKRYSKVKKHPRTPVWFPSGPLINQVLPVHYIYTFYKTSRLPRERYLKRRLLNVKTVEQNFKSYYYPLKEQRTKTNLTDFTLRKRVKPKRKYHRKNNYGIKTLRLPRRYKFAGNANEPLRWRPLTMRKIAKPIIEFVKEQRSINAKRRNNSNAILAQGSDAEQNTRLRQLRTRVQRLTIKTVWRYRPRAGGFVWPGDYLRLEKVTAPMLNKTTLQEKQVQQGRDSINQKEKVKHKRSPNIKIRANLPEWSVQSKEYLKDRQEQLSYKRKIFKVF